MAACAASIAVRYSAGDQVGVNVPTRALAGSGGRRAGVHVARQCGQRAGLRRLAGGDPSQGRGQPVAEVEVGDHRPRVGGDARGDSESAPREERLQLPEGIWGVVLEHQPAVGAVGAKGRDVDAVS